MKENKDLMIAQMSSEGFTCFKEIFLGLNILSIKIKKEVFLYFLNTFLVVINKRKKYKLL